MTLAYEVPEIHPSTAALSEVEADVLIVPVAQNERAAVDAFDAAVGGELSQALERGEFKGKSCEVWTGRLHQGQFRTRRLMLVGMGPLDDIGPEQVRRMSACAALKARQQRLSHLCLHLPEWFHSEAWTELAVEGLTVANYDNGHFKSRSDDRFFLRAVDLNAPDSRPAAIERGSRIGSAINAARLLINEPGNHLPPRELAARAASLAAVDHVTSEILDERRLEELGMGLLLGVGRGSLEPPRMLVLRYTPPGAPESPVLGLVGKGVTFDTGGISIKPADGMERMKDDMAGGATVAAALRVIALEQIPLRVVALVPCVENMPSGRAIRPGDILRAASGLTVEVNNTDAEGRLILGDALWYARELGATHLIDVATLTGAVIVALGKIATGLFGTEGWVDVLRAAADRGGEKLWPLPLFEEYRESLKSEIADMLNSPGRAAGSITAAMFLKEFTAGVPWAHLDIAGTAWADEVHAWMPKGATGTMTRTIIEVARTAGRDWPAAPAAQKRAV